MLINVFIILINSFESKRLAGGQDEYQSGEYMGGR